VDQRHGALHSQSADSRSHNDSLQVDTDARYPTGRPATRRPTQPISRQ